MVPANKTAVFFEQSQLTLLDTTLHAPQLESSHALQSTASMYQNSVPESVTQLNPDGKY